MLARAAADGHRLVLILDQSKLSDRHQVLALRHGERAFRHAWTTTPEIFESNPHHLTPGLFNADILVG